MVLLISKWTSSWAAVIQTQQGLTDERREVVAYGLYILVSETVKTAAMLLIAALLGVFPQALAVLFGTFLVKNLTGGFHADSNLVCFVWSSGMTLLCLAVMLWTPFDLSQNMYLWLSSWLTSAGLVLWLAPVVHKNKPVKSETHRRKLKRKALLIVCAAFAGSLFFRNMMSDGVLLAIWLNCMMMLPPVHHRLNKWINKEEVTP